MKPRLVLHHYAAVVMSLMLFACARMTPPTFDAASEGAKLLQRDREWADLATAGRDVEKVVSYWADDAVVLEPGQAPVEGKAAIRAMVTSSFASPGFRIHWVSQMPIFSPDGKMAYMRATQEMNVHGPNGEPMTLRLQGYTVWRLDADGQWRCVVDIASDTAPVKH